MESFCWFQYLSRKQYFAIHESQDFCLAKISFVLQEVTQIQPYSQNIQTSFKSFDNILYCQWLTLNVVSECILDGILMELLCFLQVEIHTSSVSSHVVRWLFRKVSVIEFETVLSTIGQLLYFNYTFFFCSSPGLKDICKYNLLNLLFLLDIFLQVYMTGY